MGRKPCCDKQDLKNLKKELWSPEEDELLINYINQHGHGKWRSLAKKAGLQRSGNSCRARWMNYLRPDIKRGHFTPEEENLSNRPQGLKKGLWSPEEDELLINYINQHGHVKWPSLAKRAGLQRSGNSCRARWLNYLRLDIKRGHFTPEEENLSNRPQGLKKGLWSPEEDELLINYINKHGHGNLRHGNWRSFPERAGLKRSGHSCWSRWVNGLRPGIKRGPFTREEENLVIQLQTTLGNRWSAIALQLPGRTDSAIKKLWYRHLKKRLLTKGLVPQTHEPTSKAHGPKSPITHFTYHMAQRESARLEAEARLSEESLTYNPHSSSSSYSDVFLPLWETEVGESFQKVAEKENTEKSTCQSPVSETSSSTKRAISVLTQRDEDVEVNKYSKSHIQLLNARSNSSGADVVDDSSVSELQLLLDFLENNDMSFLENDMDDYLVNPSDLSSD